MRGTLSASVNGVTIDTFKHGKNNFVDTHDSYGNINPDYNGSFKVRAECDNWCNCSFEKHPG